MSAYARQHRADFYPHLTGRRERKGLIPIRYVNCPTLKLTSVKKKGSPKSIKDAAVILVKKEIQQITLGGSGR